MVNHISNYIKHIKIKTEKEFILYGSQGQMFAYNGTEALLLLLAGHTAPFMLSSQRYVGLTGILMTATYDANFFPFIQTSK